MCIQLKGVAAWLAGKFKTHVLILSGLGGPRKENSTLASFNLGFKVEPQSMFFLFGCHQESSLLPPMSKLFSFGRLKSSRLTLQIPVEGYRRAVFLIWSWQD